MTRRKYKNKPFRDEDGIFWHSTGEHNRWHVLKLMEKAGQIEDLQRQVKVPLKVNDKLITTMVLDYSYLENETRIYEDFKGVLTPMFKLKRKLFEAITNREIRISGAKS